MRPTLTSDKRWVRLKDQVKILLEKAKTGDDLTPYLSKKINKGYAIPDAENKWKDKDFILNTTGFHHLHLCESRSKEVVFAHISRLEFDAVAIFDHSVFHGQDALNITDERKRLWKIYNNRVTKNIPANSVYVSSIISTSGHPIHVNNIASEYAHVINELDGKLGDVGYVKSLYITNKMNIPKKIKLCWYMHDLDLGWLDSDNNFFVFRFGYI